MIYWKPFEHDGQAFDLSHLHPYAHTFVQPAKGDKPESRYEVQIFFSLHCFTHNAVGGEDLSGALAYADSRETRIFDFDRYEHSKQLKEIVDGLPVTACFHTHHGNFFTVQGTNASGVVEEYEVYFTASKSSTVRDRLNLYVQSAYVRDRQHTANRPAKKKISFFVILHNTLNGRPIKPAP